MHDGARHLYRFDSTAEQLSKTQVLPVGGPATIAISPPAGGSVTVEFSCSSTADLASGNALFVPAGGVGEAGVVAQLTVDSIPSTITAVRVTASAPGARVEIAQ